jgi:hypothetical protein
VGIVVDVVEMDLPKIDQRGDQQGNQFGSEAARWCRGGKEEARPGLHQKTPKEEFPADGGLFLHSLANSGRMIRCNDGSIAE